MTQTWKSSSNRSLLTVAVIIAALLAAYYGCERWRAADQINIGRKWAVCEPICGTWTRQGESSTWNGAWQNGAVATLTMTVSGRSVTVLRDDTAGVSRGLKATYTGTITPSGQIENGRVEWRWPQGFGTRNGTWTGTIDGGSR